MRLGLEKLRIPGLEDTQKLLAEVGQGQARQFGDIDVQFPGKERADGVVLVSDRGQERHYLAGHGGGLQMQGVIGNHTDSIVHKEHGDFGAVPVAPHEHSDLAVPRPGLMHLVHSVQNLPHLILPVAENDIDTSAGGIL